MLSDFLKNNITSKAGYVEYGYGQVEPNHLSAQRTAQMYAQLPAAASIDVLEQGQFVKYDYMNGECNFTGEGEWMLVYNEIKLYRDFQADCEFAMVKDNYQARIYSPYKEGTSGDAQSRYYNGKDSAGNETITVGDETYRFDDVTAAPDMYELHYNEDPFHFQTAYSPEKMKDNTTMVPRVFKTNVGDIFTTNTIKEADVALGDILAPGTDGILSTAGDVTKMKWQVVKKYTMPDGQKGVKVMRVA